MYVVQVIANDGGADYRTFGSLPDALRGMKSTEQASFDDLRSAKLFDVPGVRNPQFAIALVDSGRAVLLGRSVSDSF